MSGPLVDILCPTARKWDPEQCFSFTHVCLHAAMTGVLRSVLYRKWLYIDPARNELVEEHLSARGATHALFLDDDMVFPPDLVPRLLAHDVPVVGATYFTRTPPHDVVCGNFDGGAARNLQRLPKGLERICWVGAGALLIRSEVFGTFREKHPRVPWFRSEEGGEDVWFCRLLHMAGVPIFVDGGTVCRHVTDTTVGEEHWKHYHGGEG